MNAQLSQKQWQKLTDYLDGTLSSQDQAAVERLIATTPGLREELQSIQQTRKLLRNLSPRRLPRNFTLTPEMVRKKSISGFWLFPFLSVTSGVSALILVLLFAFQSLLASPQTAQPAAMEAAPAVAMQSDSSMESTQPPDIILWGGPAAYGMGGGSGGDATGKGSGPAASFDSQMPMEKSGSAEAPQAAMPLPENIQPEVMGTPVPSTLMAEPMPSEAANAAPRVEPTAAPLDNSGPILGLPSKEQEGKILEVPTSTVLPTAPTPVQQPVGKSSLPIPFLQVGLALITLLTGLGALYVRWKSHNA